MKLNKALVSGVVAVSMFSAFTPLVLNQSSSVVSAAKKAKIKYNTAFKIEKALNKGQDLSGKTVRFKVTKLVPNSAFGYNLETGKHLNFVSTSHPKVKKGQTVTLKIKKISSMFGSYVITYTNLRKK